MFSWHHNSFHSKSVLRSSRARVQRRQQNRLSHPPGIHAELIVPIAARVVGGTAAAFFTLQFNNPGSSAGNRYLYLLDMFLATACSWVSFRTREALCCRLRLEDALPAVSAFALSSTLACLDVAGARTHELACFSGIVLIWNWQRGRKYFLN